VNAGREAAKKKDFGALGEIMNLNQGFLEKLGVGSARLSAMINAAREAGALGAKLSGAGKGDCMIALAASDPPVPNGNVRAGQRSAVSRRISEAGGTVIDIPCNVEGLKLES